MNEGSTSARRTRRASCPSKQVPFLNMRQALAACLAGTTARPSGSEPPNVPRSRRYRRRSSFNSIHISCGGHGETFQQSLAQSPPSPQLRSVTSGSSANRKGLCSSWRTCGRSCRCRNKPALASLFPLCWCNPRLQAYRWAVKTYYMRVSLPDRGIFSNTVTLEKILDGDVHLGASET